MVEEIRAWFRRLKTILQLGEYEIALHLDPNLEALGDCVVDPRAHSDPTYQQAVIRMRDPEAGNAADWKRTLLHEMIHVRMGGTLGTEPGSEERSALERGVEMMTRILFRMITGGASDAAVSRVAAGCARSLKTARDGMKRGSMGNGKRILEIVAALAQMQLPEEAQVLVTELGGLAIDDSPESVDPAAAKPDDVPVDPAMAAMPPAYRKKIADSMARIDADMSVAESVSIVSRAKAEIGEASFRPVWEAKLRAIKRGDDARRSFVEGLKSGLAAAPKAPAAPLKREPGVALPLEKPNAVKPLDDKGEPIVLTGEDATKIPQHVALARAALGGAFGHARVVKVLSNGTEVIQ